MSAQKRAGLLRWGILGLAVLFLGLSLWRQEPQDVLQKAVRICLECIGVG